MQHTPKLHIFIGQFNHFFTLRESYLHTIYIGRINPKPVYEIRYAHLKNLSQNYQEAVEKAQEASKQLGIELVVKGSETEQLDEIKRVTAEEAEQRRRLAQEEYARAEEEAQARRREYWNTWKVETLQALEGKKVTEFNISDIEIPEGFIEKITALGWVQSTEDPEIFTRVEEDKDGPRMVGGAWHGYSFKSVPRSYLQWLVLKSGLCEIDAEETMHRMAFVAQWIRDNVEVPEIKESNWVGEVGQKIELDVSIENVRTLEGQYGYTYLYKMLDENGNDITWFASRAALKGLNKAKIKGTIKKHSEFNGRKQTVLTRVKVI